MHITLADPGGAPGARAPPSPHFWGPRLYSEAQIAPFYTQITEKFSKNFASLRSAYYFNSQLTYFDQKHSKIIHFWGPRLYSEAQIAPFYTQITEKFSKTFCLTSLGILFQFSIDIFWSKTFKNYSFLRPQIIFWGPNCTFLHSNNRKIFKNILPHFPRHTISILNWHILIKKFKNYSFLRP